MQNIILSLLQRISSLPEIAYASADWGQLSYDVPPVEWPCALIDISQVSLHDHLQEQQSAEGIITVTLADYIDAPAQALDPPEDYALEMRIYSAIDALHQALQGYNTAGFSPLSRRSIRRVSGSPGLRVFAIEYLSSWTETIDLPPTQPVRPCFSPTVTLRK